MSASIKPLSRAQMSAMKKIVNGNPVPAEPKMVASLSSLGFAKLSADGRIVLTVLGQTCLRQQLEAR